MRSLGLDVGDKRIGIALSDPDGLMAVPLTIIAAADDKAAVAEIGRLVEQYKVERMVIGLPRSLSGDIGRQADKVTAFAERLGNAIGVGIQLWDERFSTVAVDKLMAGAGTKRRKRKQHRDALAAAFILQGFLDSCRSERGQEPD